MDFKFMLILFQIIISVSSSASDKRILLKDKAPACLRCVDEMAAQKKPDGSGSPDWTRYKDLPPSCIACSKLLQKKGENRDHPKVNANRLKDPKHVPTVDRNALLFRRQESVPPVPPHSVSTTPIDSGANPTTLGTTNPETAAASDSGANVNYHYHYHYNKPINSSSVPGEESTDVESTDDESNSEEPSADSPVPAPVIGPAPEPPATPAPAPSASSVPDTAASTVPVPVPETPFVPFQCPDSATSPDPVAYTTPAPTPSTTSAPPTSPATATTPAPPAPAPASASAAPAAQESAHVAKNHGMPSGVKSTMSVLDQILMRFRSTKPPKMKP